MFALLNNPKKLIYFLVILLISIGAINVLSASFLESGYAYFIRHFAYGIIGFAVMYYISKKDYRFFLRSNILQLAYVGVLVLLLLVDAIGAVNKGAQRWLYLGPISIQPSELAKLVVIMMSAKLLGNMLQKGEYISLPVKSAIRKYSLNLVNQDTEIKISKLGERAGAFGACLLSRSKLLGMIHY